MTVFTSLLVVVALQQDTAPRPRVVIEPDSITLEVDRARQLQALRYDAQGNPVDTGAVRWISSNETVAGVDSTGRVTALRPGVARIFAVAAGTPGTAVVVVPELPPAQVELWVPVGVVPAGTSVPLEVTVTTRLGDTLRDASVRYESVAPAVAAVDQTGRIFARTPGLTLILAWAGPVRGSADIRVGRNLARDYEIIPEGASVRTGDVVRFTARGVAADGRIETGFQPIWAVSGVGASIAAEGPAGLFVAERPGTYRVTAVIGEETTRSVAVRVSERNTQARLVKVGRGPITGHNSGDMWSFQGVDGRDYVYIGTFMYDWMKVWDVTDPANPVLTDSVQVDARRINDVKIHPNNRLAVTTREGASDRRNGIVLLDLSTPAHPTILSQYTETLTGGVHNVWIRGDENLVYACHNGTSELHIIDISDPTSPREVGRWGLPKRFKTLHDVIVQDGYAYLSYWDDGAVMLDVGAGTHGGTPTRPTLVSQFAYPIGNTHTAWRHGRYLFVGDEIFPPDWNPDAPLGRRGLVEARGYVHVLDYSDPERPREVARYEVPEAGAHNVWVERDRLYVGYYQGGLRVVDISGELRGDLYRQGRELAVLKTTDDQTTVPNWPMTWGAQLFKGHIFSSDLNSGLWVTKLMEERPVP